VGRAPRRTLVRRGAPGANPPPAPPKRVGQGRGGRLVRWLRASRARYDLAMRWSRPVGRASSLCLWMPVASRSGSRESLSKRQLLVELEALMVAEIEEFVRTMSKRRTSNEWERLVRASLEATVSQQSKIATRMPGIRRNRRLLGARPTGDVRPISLCQLPQTSCGRTLRLRRASPLHLRQHPLRAPRSGGGSALARRGPMVAGAGQAPGGRCQAVAGRRAPAARPGPPSERGFDRSAVVGTDYDHCHRRHCGCDVRQRVLGPGRGTDVGTCTTSSVFRQAHGRQREGHRLAASRSRAEQPGAREQFGEPVCGAMQ
jgi:hypothetical protein